MHELAWFGPLKNPKMSYLKRCGGVVFVLSWLFLPACQFGNESASGTSSSNISPSSIALSNTREAEVVWQMPPELRLMWEQELTQIAELDQQLQLTEKQNAAGLVAGLNAYERDLLKQLHASLDVLENQLAGQVSQQAASSTSEGNLGLEAELATRPTLDARLSVLKKQLGL